jgi:hypothetical protein
VKRDGDPDAAQEMFLSQLIYRPVSIQGHPPASCIPEPPGSRREDLRVLSLITPSGVRRRQLRQPISAGWTRCQPPWPNEICP